MPAIRLLDTEHQMELAYLHEQLITGEPVQDKSWRYAEEYLMQLGIYNVILVEENDVRNYKRFLLEDRDCTIRAANSMTSFLRNKKAHWIEQEYGDLLEEIRQCEGIEMPLTGNIKNFLIREGIHHIREIDYPIREKYEQYLMKEKKPEQVLRYLKTLDRIKQYHIRQEMKQFANTKKFYLKYEQQILFLPYLPDQKLAMEFDKVRDKTELVWDFSVKASEKMKQQIFQLLIHILENVKDPKDRRVRFLLPMQWMYQYCIKQGIVDIETMEQEEVEKLEEIVKQKVVNYKNSMQIVDNSRKILFMSGKQIHWHANVWYMEKFHLAPERVNPCNPVNRLSFYQVENLNNRKLLQEYARYQIGITGLTIGNIRSQQNYVKKFLKYLGPDVCALDVTEKQIGAYFKEIQQQEIQAETVNRQILDITKFYEYLKIKNHIKEIPFHPEYYEQKVYPIHHDRSVEEDIYMEILHKLNLFPEELRLIFLHLWATGLRISEVCTLKGDAYYWDGEDAWIKVYQIKMKADKMIPVPFMLYEVMQQYIKKNHIHANDYVFQAEQGGAYRIGSFVKRFRTQCKKHKIADCEYVFKTHDYRHTLATQFYDDGVPIQTIRDYLGHVAEEMTKQYVDYMPKKIEKANDNYFDKPENNIALTITPKKRRYGHEKG